MKIAYLFGSLNRGGAETLVLNIYRNAKRYKLNCIGIYRKTGVYEKEFIESGITQIKLSIKSNLIIYFISLRKLLISNNIDIVHAQQPIDALFAYLACLGTGIKIVLTFHGYDFNFNIIDKIIYGFTIKNTDKNIFVSNTQRNYYIKKYNLKSNSQIMVYNGISFREFSEVSNDLILKQNIRTELNLSNDTLLLGSVGNFNEVRDQLTICRFLKLLKNGNLNFHFVFVGKRMNRFPEFYDECFDFCKNNNLLSNVTFLGSRDDVNIILTQLSTFIYSTDQDTFGLAIIEAMAANIPVFVNDWNVMNEITENGKFATIFKTKDEFDLYQKFNLYLKDNILYQLKAQAAKKYVENTFSIENHIKNMKIVYNDCLK